MTQLFGDRAVIANATGCSSIYGGNLPTTPYTTRADGQGPAWANSLFEDNAEFGMGFRLTIDKFTEYALELLDSEVKGGCVKPELAEAIKNADQSTQEGIEAQRARVEELKAALAKCDCDLCKQLESLADYLVKKSVWIVGGDGWAYDIGYGGLDHVIASGKNVNLLVLDTEVYSNTGGQMSKATPRAATAKFAAGGKPTRKKDLAMMAMSYGSVYVARVSLANPAHLVKALIEAEAYDGPSIVICYSHCIAHGINTTFGVEEQKKAVASGHWILMRYNPDACRQGRESAAARLQGADHQLRGIRLRREPLPRPEEDQPRRGDQAHGTRRGRHQARLAALQGHVPDEPQRQEGRVAVALHRLVNIQRGRGFRVPPLCRWVAIWGALAIPQP